MFSPFKARLPRRIPQWAGLGPTRKAGSTPRFAQVVTSEPENRDNDHDIGSQVPPVRMPGHPGGPFTPSQSSMPKPHMEPAPLQPAEAGSPVQPSAMDQQDEFWRKTAIWENVSSSEFLSYRWSVSTLQIYIYMYM